MFVFKCSLKMEKVQIYYACILIVQLQFSSALLIPTREKCPEVRAMPNFNIFNILGSWYVVQYYSSSEEALTYHCMRAEFGLSSGYMDMIMKLTYMYVDDPRDEAQTGNMTWQIPDPRRPEHWRHTENPYKGVYNTDVIDTDYTSWLILLHCSDPESEKKFLSTFVLSRTAYIDRSTTEYLREKIGNYNVPMEYLFTVNQTFCFGESNYVEPEKEDTKNQNTKIIHVSYDGTVHNLTSEELPHGERIENVYSEPGAEDSDDETIDADTGKENEAEDESQ